MQTDVATICRAERPGPAMLMRHQGVRSLVVEKTPTRPYGRLLC